MFQVAAPDLSDTTNNEIQVAVKQVSFISANNPLRFTLIFCNAFVNIYRRYFVNLGFIFL